MKRILVTGATGFIGRHCLPLLIEKGYEVHAISLNEHNSDLPGVFWHQADLLNIKETGKLVAFIKATHLLHLAWYTAHNKYWTAPENIDWVQASFALIKAFRANAGSRAIVAGTCAEYEWGHGLCSEDTTPLLPASLYGVSRDKLRQEIEAFSGETGLSSTWARIFFVYGPGEHPSRLVSSVIASLLSGKPVPCSEGSQERDFLYVEDVASAFVAIIESKFEGAINIGSGVAVPVRKVINTISEKIGRPDLIQFAKLPTNMNEPALLIADVKKLREVAGWSAQYDLDRGIDKTIQWWKDNLKKHQISYAK